jgi:hypothetical protein
MNYDENGFLILDEPINAVHDNEPCVLFKRDEIFMISKDDYEFNIIEKDDLYKITNLNLIINKKHDILIDLINDMNDIYKIVSLVNSLGKLLDFYLDIYNKKRIPYYIKKSKYYKNTLLYAKFDNFLVQHFHLNYYDVIENGKIVKDTNYSEQFRFLYHLEFDSFLIDKSSNLVSNIIVYLQLLCFQNNILEINILHIIRYIIFKYKTYIQLKCIYGIILQMSLDKILLFFKFSLNLKI